MTHTDNQLLERLRRLDDAIEIDVSSEEADFLELVCFKLKGSMSAEQREEARRLLRRYRF